MIVLVVFGAMAALAYTAVAVSVLLICMAVRRIADLLDAKPVTKLAPVIRSRDEKTAIHIPPSFYGAEGKIERPFPESLK